MSACSLQSKIIFKRLTPLVSFITSRVEENVASPLLLPRLVHVSDGKQLGLVLHSQVAVSDLGKIIVIVIVVIVVVAEDLADMSIDAEALR